MVESYSYDAWGRRRNTHDWTYNNVAMPTLMCRGYTFHEHMDEFALLNMNGRAYDPVVGRFLNADPIVQNGSSTQSYNRYSYCLNNPLKYRDPSGYDWSPVNTIQRISEQQTAMAMIEARQACEELRYAWMNGSVNIIGPWTRNANKKDGGSNSLVNAVGNFLDVVNMIANISPIFSNFMNLPGSGNYNDEDVSDGDPPDNDENNQSGTLSSPTEFAKELKYYFKFNSGTTYILSKERFDDIYAQAHDNNAIKWEDAVKNEDGSYSIPVDFYKTEYAYAFGTATMIFSFGSQKGFEPIGFYDLWDLDPKPWGKRPYPAEIITRYYNLKLGDGNNFEIIYP